MPQTTKKTATKTKKSTVKKVLGRRRSSSKRQKKPVFSDIVRASVLAGLIIAAAAFISAVFIVIHMTMRGMEEKAGAHQPNFAVLQPESVPVSEPPAPAAKSPVPAAEAVGQGSPGKTEIPVIPLPVERTVRPEAVLREPPAASSVVNTIPAKPVEKPVEKIIEKPAAQPVAPSPVNSTQTRPVVQPQRSQPPQIPEYKGSVAIIIDDAGNNLVELEPFLRLSGPLTIAVLPGLPYSAEAARRIRAAGKEVFLHQPMEALGGQPPGPGAIYTGMSVQETRNLLKKNLAELGPVAGMNNHQGSKITVDRQLMETVLEFCREQGIYFLDSRTTADTVVPEVAQRLGIKIGARNIFIDNEQDKASINRSIRDGLGRAQQQGSVVMIGHVWSPELAPLLAELYPNIVDQGYTFTTASAHITAAKN